MNYKVEREHWHKPCAVPACHFVVHEDNEYGEHWTTDDEGNFYCMYHNDSNPTSDDYDPGNPTSDNYEGS